MATYLWSLAVGAHNADVSWGVLLRGEKGIERWDSIVMASAILFGAHRIKGHVIDPDCLHKAAQFVRSSQGGCGGWPAFVEREGFSIEATAIAMHGLALARPPGWQGALEQGARFLRQRQSSYGHWTEPGSPDSVWLTVLVLDALELARGGSQVTFNLQLPEEAEPLRQAGRDAERDMRKRFSFEPGQARFDGEILRVGTGAPLEVLRLLVMNSSSIVPFQKLDADSNPSEASEKVRAAIARLRRTLKSAGVPVSIENRRGEGYILLPAGG